MRRKCSNILSTALPEFLFAVLRIVAQRVRGHTAPEQLLVVRILIVEVQNQGVNGIISTCGGFHPYLPSASLPYRHKRSGIPAGYECCPGR